MARRSSGRHSVARGASQAIRKHVAKSGKYGTKTPASKSVRSGSDAQQRIAGNGNGTYDNVRA